MTSPPNAAVVSPMFSSGSEYEYLPSGAPSSADSLTRSFERVSVRSADDGDEIVWSVSSLASASATSPVIVEDDADVEVDHNQDRVSTDGNDAHTDDADAEAERPCGVDEFVLIRGDAGSRAYTPRQRGHRATQSESALAYLVHPGRGASPASALGQRPARVGDIGNIGAAAGAGARTQAVPPDSAAVAAAVLDPAVQRAVRDPPPHQGTSDVGPNSPVPARPRSTPEALSAAPTNTTSPSTTAGAGKAKGAMGVALQKGKSKRSRARARAKAGARAEAKATGTGVGAATVTNGAKERVIAGTAASRSYPSPAPTPRPEGAGTPSQDQAKGAGRWRSKPKPKSKAKPKPKVQEMKTKAPAADASAPSTAPSTPRGLGRRSVVDDVSENGDAQTQALVPHKESLLSTAYDEAVSFMNSFIKHPHYYTSKASRLTFLQALIVELGLVSAREPARALPGSLTAATQLLKTHAFLSVRDYLAVRAGGLDALRRAMHPSRRALVAALRGGRKKKGEEGARAPLGWVKETGLTVLLVRL